MKKLISLFLIIIVLLVLGIWYRKIQNKNVSLPVIDSTSPTKNTNTTASSEITTVAKNLDTPWGIAFLPDKSMLITEREGKVRFIDSSGKLDAMPVVILEAVKEISEGGLLGIALHPKFASNKYVYLYYTYSGSGNNTINRVVRMTFDNKKLSDEKIIVDKIPGAPNHNGGRIKFGPDTYLYITTGDAQDPSQAQDKNALGGKILRVTDEGKAAPGNPFNTLIYSYGHRNPQGIAWDSNGMLWETEHGRSFPSGLDEINLIESGKNYGWPDIEGDETRQGMITPNRNSGANVTWAPAGAAFIEDSLFFAGLRGQTLYEAIIKNNKVVEIKEHVKGQYGRLRDVVVGPDDMLYITTSNKDGRGIPSSTADRILKVNPQKL